MRLPEFCTGIDLHIVGFPTLALTMISVAGKALSVDCKFILQVHVLSFKLVIGGKVTTSRAELAVTIAGGRADLSYLVDG